MSIRRDQFVVDINYHQKQYTPQQIAGYIINSSDEGHADQQKLKELIQQSKSELDKLVDEHQVEMDKPLDTSSDIGKAIAALALRHCDSTIRLIRRGGRRRGIRI